MDIIGLQIPNLDRKLANLLDTAFVIVGTTLSMIHALEGGRQALEAPPEEDDEEAYAPSSPVQEARESLLRAHSSTVWFVVVGLTVVRLFLMLFDRLAPFWALLVVQLIAVSIWGESLRERRRAGRALQVWRAGLSRFTRGILAAFGCVAAALLGRGCLELPFP